MGLFEALLEPESIGASTVAIGRLPMTATDSSNYRLRCNVAGTLFESIYGRTR
jgi:hypothetical protein